ncbi:MAG TPA: D-alanine--D-alanine ligase family protein [bacterium]|jgi:D-alanine-D-alanine ligase|nr:D-alanine--D-alanine ligase family protein [bacterium]
MKKKITVGILFGGKSTEHEVSLLSAKNVVEALDKNKYQAVLIKITKEGKWQLENKNVVRASNTEIIKTLDVVFPVLHGPLGEDGAIQGLLKIMDVPFIGPSILASALGMDKEVAKRLWRDAGIPSAKFLVFKDHEINSIQFSKVKKELGLPLFIKPANLGSSVGVSKVHNEKAFRAAINNAFKYDLKILIEECIKGREIECAVLGNEEPIASIPGEIIPQAEFYSYKAKYFDEHGAILQIPAKLSVKEQKYVKQVAIKAFQTLGCEGMARVDFFLTKNGKLVINEINTIPGFTNISMYPKLWEISGIPYSKLIDILINLAISRYKKEKKLRTSV